MSRLSGKERKKIGVLKETRNELMEEVNYQMELVEAGQRYGQDTTSMNGRVGLLFKKMNELSAIIDKIYGVVDFTDEGATNSKTSEVIELGNADDISLADLPEVTDSPESPDQ